MKNLTIAIVILAILGLGYFFYRSRQNTATPATNPTNPNNSSPASPANPFAGFTVTANAHPVVVAGHTTNGTGTNTTPAVVGAVTIHPQVETQTIPTPAAVTAMISKYITPVNGTNIPTLEDWFAAMHSKTGFNTWLTNVRAYKKAPMYQAGPLVGQNDRWYIIDTYHYIRVAIDNHGWPFQFMLLTQSNMVSTGLIEPNVPPEVDNTPQPDPTTWWGQYNAIIWNGSAQVELADTDGPATASGTALFPCPVAVGV